MTGQQEAADNAAREPLCAPLTAAGEQTPAVAGDGRSATDVAAAAAPFGPDAAPSMRYWIGTTETGGRVSVSLGPSRWKGPQRPVPLSAFHDGARPDDGDASAALLVLEPHIGDVAMWPVDERTYREWSSDDDDIDDEDEDEDDAWADVLPGSQ